MLGLFVIITIALTCAAVFVAMTLATTKKELTTNFTVVGIVAAVIVVLYLFIAPIGIIYYLILGAIAVGCTVVFHPRRAALQALT